MINKLQDKNISNPKHVYKQMQMEYTNNNIISDDGYSGKHTISLITAATLIVMIY